MANRKSILVRKASLRRFGGVYVCVCVGRGGSDGGLACDILKFVFLHRFFYNQESFLRRKKFNANKA